MRRAGDTPGGGQRWERWWAREDQGGGAKGNASEFETQGASGAPDGEAEILTVPVLGLDANPVGRRAVEAALLVLLGLQRPEHRIRRLDDRYSLGRLVLAVRDGLAREGAGVRPALGGGVVELQAPAPFRGAVRRAEVQEVAVEEQRVTRLPEENRERERERRETKLKHGSRGRGPGQKGSAPHTPRTPQSRQSPYLHPL